MTVVDPAVRLRQLSQDVSRWKGRREHASDLLERSREKHERGERQMEALEQAIQVLQAATETRRQELKTRVESLVTRGLRAVFGREDYEFTFKVSLKRDVFGVIPMLRSKYGDREIETTVAGSRGGGIANVVAFLLRVIVMSLARPKVAPVLVLDESFSMVSADKLRGVASLLRELNETAGIQFVLVTHKEELLDAADVIYRVKLENGRSTFTLEHDLRDELAHSRPKRGKTVDSKLTLFDHEDMTGPVSDAEAVEAPTDDLYAKKQRFLSREAKKAKRSARKRPKK